LALALVLKLLGGVVGEGGRVPGWCGLGRDKDARRACDQRSVCIADQAYLVTLPYWNDRNSMSLPPRLQNGMSANEAQQLHRGVQMVQMAQIDELRIASSVIRV